MTINSFFEEIVGQQKVKETLAKILESRRVPHAFLFYGPKCSGKYFTALQFSKILNSEEQTNKANILQKISHLQEPYIKYITALPRGKGESSDDGPTDKLSKDIIEQIRSEFQIKIENPYHFFKVDGANSIKISSIRDIKKFLNTTLDDIGFRFIIIEDAHLMNDQSQNALLKSLEEPPEGVVFILLTDKKEQILTTIQSRCWQIDFRPLSKSEMKLVLEKFYNSEIENLDLVLDFAEGSLSKALELVNHNIKSTLDTTVELLRYSLAKKYNSAIKIINDFIAENSKDSVNLLLSLIKIWLLDAQKNKLSFNDYLSDTYEDTLEKFNNRYQNANLPELIKMIESLEDAYNRNVNLNVFCLNLIFGIASLSIRKD